MTDLNTAYQTLIARGMRPLARLRPSIKRGQSKSAFRYVPPHYDRMQGYAVPMDDEDARDMIAVHALRWISASDNLSWRDWLYNLAACVGTDTILDAILAATEHLTPPRKEAN